MELNMMELAETKTGEKKRNGTKSTRAKTDKPKPDPLFFEVPIVDDEALRWLTDKMKTERRMEVNAISFRVDSGRLMVGCLPTEGQ